MIKDLNFDLFDVINKVSVDKYGRVSAFLAINKPVGITSHDVVDEVRKRLKTRKVGHAGALDPFASGVMLVLVGKEYTRLSDSLMQLDKSYRAHVLFGASTDTLDVEGKVISESTLKSYSFNKVVKAVKNFEGGYEQFVPVYSSVKVDGNKLRVLARQSENFEIEDEEGTRSALFHNIKGRETLKVSIPLKFVTIENITVYEKKTVKQEQYEFLNTTNINNKSFPSVEIEFDCTKGTYVRQFAADLARKIGEVGMLINLQRTRIGQIGIQDTIALDELIIPKEIL